MRAATAIMILALLAIALFAPIAHASEADDFDSIEEDMDLEAENLVPNCRGIDPNTQSLCKKGDNISRGAGFSASNELACTTASEGRGCEAVGDLFFPKCIASYHAVGSLCTENCPMGWAEQGASCVKTAGLAGGSAMALRMAGAVLTAGAAQASQASIPVPGGVQIFAKTITGKMIPVDVLPSDSIQTVKIKIQDKDGVPAEQQQLIFGGKPLEDHQTVAECNLQTGAIMTLVLRIRGGSMHMMRRRG